LDINDYNENAESLKISKERNDFVDSLSQRKFIKLMRDIVVAIFTRIDIAVKNPPFQSVYLRNRNLIGRIGEKINLSTSVVCSNVGLDEIDLDYDESLLQIDDDWMISANNAGSYEIKLGFDEKIYSIMVHFKDIIPEFELTKTMITIYEGNSANLRDYINAKSCKDVTPDSITILSENKDTIIKNDLFDRNNPVGQHLVYYRVGDYQRTLLITVKEIERQPGAGAKSPRINVLFPNLDNLRERSFKIPEIVDAISSYYVQAPTLCMAAIRILIESSGKAFFQSMIKEESLDNFPSLVNRVINLRNCDLRSQDYIKYILPQDAAYITSFKEISVNYITKLSKDIKTNINAHLKEIDLDMFIHNPTVVATDTTVYKAMQIFSPLLNYIFEILLIEKK
jgi:hypothetical protein